MKYYILLVILPLLFIASGCKTEDNPITPIAKKTNEQLYNEAVVDALVAEPGEICNNLIAVKPDNNYLTWTNGYVLVVTWTKYSSSYPVNDTISTWWGETWVTAVPEMKDWFKNNQVQKENLVLRSEQLLGLPENTGYNFFVEMWVKPEDLLRPSYDNEINDNICGLSFPETAGEDYINWFNNNIISSYYPPADDDKYPWTRLGYTYDWGNPSDEIGLSEFIIKKNAKVIVKSVQLNEDYLK